MPRFHILFSVIILIEGIANSVAAVSNFLDNVNTLIGTSYFENQLDVHDYGNTAPFAGPPFAHTPWTAQTRDSEDKCQSPYYYFDSYWHGMRRSHWMSGSCTIDYGSATLIPSITNNLNEALTFHAMNHSAEISTPAYYKIDLHESSLRVEAASDIRAGIMKVLPVDTKNKYFYLIFKASDTMYNESSVNILQNSASEVSDDADSARQSSGESLTNSVDSLTVTSPVHRWYQSKQKPAGFSGHHYFKTSRPAIEYGVIEGYSNIKIGQLSGVSDSYGTVAAYFKFETADGEVSIATGTSFISVEKARENMYFELDSREDYIFGIDRLIEKVTDIWEKKLGAINATPYIDNSEIVSNKKNERVGGQIISNNSSKNQLITFYSALWHTQLLPRIVSDFDGEYLSFGETRIVERTSSNNGFTNYFDDFSMWDVFRAQMPLFSLIYTENVQDMVTSLLRKAENGGFLPIFPAWNSYTDEMIGDHCAVMIADNFLKGVLVVNKVTNGNNDELLSTAYKFLTKNALSIPDDIEYKKGKGRRALKSYVQNGFIPLDDLVLDSAHIKQQVSRTLEYATDDYVVSQLSFLYAKSLSDKISRIEVLDPHRTIKINNERIKVLKSEVANATSIGNELLKRSQSYRWVIDGNTDNIWYDSITKSSINVTENNGNSVGFVRGRYANLTWAENTDSFDPSTYYTWLTETNVWQYTFSVLHDVPGLIEIYEGPEKFIEKLDKFFDESWYNHGNEPDHHVLFLYAYVKGSSWKIQHRLPEIIESQYGPVERSMSGNDDAGQMSAWLVLTSLGFYQVCPGCGGRNEYVLGLPLFSHVEVILPYASSAHSAPSGPSSATSTSATSSISTPLGADDCGSKVPLEGDPQGNCKTLLETDERTLVIDAIRINSKISDKYIQLVTWNGCTYDCAFFPHEMLAMGGHLIVYLGPEPLKTWGGDGYKCMDQYKYPLDEIDPIQTFDKILIC